MTSRWLWHGKIPSLDGLRGISILAVAVHHGMMACGWSGTGILGFVGVDIFFVISGFLITLLLLREHRRTAAISITGFYFRRACRILPAYAAFLVALALLRSQVPLAARDWLTLLTYTVNFTHVPWEISHVWSLCVEEHFYLLWPLVVVAGGRNGAWRASLACLIIAPVVRALVIHFGPDALDVAKSTPCRIDTLAAGCALACLVTDPRNAELFSLSRGKAALFAGGLLVALLAFKAILIVVGQEFLTIYSSLNALALAGLVWLAVSHSDSLVGRVLNTRLLASIGVLSYSLYIWHKLFITPHHVGWWTDWPANVVILAVTSLLSYFAIERPFLLLKDRGAALTVARDGQGDIRGVNLE
jgi:peptidoglycan/LPS O-acetylase OafA/YrhL